jgi:4-alpha-glucanotransferase
MTTVLSGRRSSGLLLHPTSLAGPHGSGDLGPEAHDFVDFLAAGGQSWWQMLPVGPPGAAPGFSPYSSYSAFAGSPYLISLELLKRDRLLDARDIAPPPAVRRGADLEKVFEFRESRLRRAFERFERASRDHREQFEIFCEAQWIWLDDFALFSALKQHFNGASWLQWDRRYRLRLRGALEEARKQLAREVRYHQFVQYIFQRQWDELRSRCRAKSIGLIGDIPIFVALDSADVWANPKLFVLDTTGQPTVVSGCPPDIFNPDGQLWGHPQYNWSEHRRTGFGWWVKRFQSMMHRFEAVRIDHFLGFHRAWAVPARAKTARKGKWLPGPREELFAAVNKAMGKVPVIAEDLGAVTDEALALRDKFKYPGMRVIQFGFGEGGQYHLPHNFPRRCVAYTGTHDNDTAVGWFKQLAQSNGHVKSQKAKERHKAMRYLGVRDAREIHWAMIKSAMLSPAETVIFPVQDVLGLGAEARMNVPGEAENQWRWRLRAGALTRESAKRLKELTELSDREE